MDSHHEYPVKHDIPVRMLELVNLSRHSAPCRFPISKIRWFQRGDLVENCCPRLVRSVNLAWLHWWHQHEVHTMVANAMQAAI